MKNLIRTTVCMVCISVGIGSGLFAQVGVNTSNVDSSAALHIDGKGKRGLLLPVVPKGSRSDIGGHFKAGLLVYDEADDMFYYWNADSLHGGANKGWAALNPLRANQTPETETETVRLTNGGERLTIDNKVTINDSLTVKKSLEVTETVKTVVVKAGTVDAGNITATGTVAAGNVNAGTGTVAAGNVNATGTVTATTVTATTVTATTFNGNGTIPLGGIIMWSGTTAPAGWALCNGGTVNGYTTPDLSGRFIVGHNGSGYTSGNHSTKGTTNGSTGGEATHALTTSEMPSHNHNALYGRGVRHGDEGTSYTPISGFGKGNVLQLSTASKSQVDGDGGETNNTGGDQAHENRPPYYALAYIMRVQ
jgi:microcystin-dependent protein